MKVRNSDCVCVSACVYMHVCTCACVHMHLYVCVLHGMCVCVSAYVSVHVYISVCACVWCVMWFMCMYLMYP